MKQIKLFLILILIASLGFSCASAGKDSIKLEGSGSESGLKVERPEVPQAHPLEPVEDRLKEDTAPKAAIIEEVPGDSDFTTVYNAEEDAAGYGYELEKRSEAVSAAGSDAFVGYSANRMPASGLKAGYADDNRQYGYFLSFLEEYRQSVVPLGLDVRERIMLNLHDSEGRSISGAKVTVSADGNTIKGLTLADGTYQINPVEIFHPYDRDVDMLEIAVRGGSSSPDFEQTLLIDRNGKRNIELSSDSPRITDEAVPVDIVFVMDTTGSMGEEINRLKNTIQIIHMNLSSMKNSGEIRFGMVLYKDIGDEYRTQLIPLTSDIDFFQAALSEVQAYGGGDTPEDLEAALGELINSIKWNADAVKLSYVITDAPPHLDYQTQYSCADALKDAREKGIKIFTIGTGGLDIQGEYNLRQMAQYTSARYIFLIYGEESGESSGGAPGSVSHHTGSNWSADKLESIVIRFTREELAHLSDSPLPEEDPWFEADRIEDEKAEDTLADLFGQTLNQLIDYASVPLTEKNLLAVLPFSYEGELAANAEYFNEHLILAAGRHKGLSLAERKDIAQLLSEIEFQNLGITDDEDVSRIGEFLNADVLLIGNLFTKDGKFELFLKLIRVETSEILSVTRAVIDSELGL